ncbi:DUF423 domain-containing protein [Crocinitomicaceae bacterium CZZ-1]|uniref:DUF423 domain-containing protein n=1 Tax=Taishania pollutisoli TaxID=2766479 RepID=A0A8J6PFU7_9FLAO|nr:DUF423 domain-containing protein [Taishania pollutisoli]MBC9810881.1 DUF423 domain-containing protein [Taishania pollutisoli]MBX2949564.1 DUF423 domain-containing protein [Crocinitomicaceae bacterium]
MNKKIVITAAALLALAIILGAFGAHGLKAIVSPEKVESFETGVKYQFYSAFGLLILGLNTAKFHFSLKAVHSLLLIGTFLFSFSIYFLSLQEYWQVKLSFLGPVTPLGGVLMIAAWMVFIVKLAASSAEPKNTLD